MIAARFALPAARFALAFVREQIGPFGGSRAQDIADLLARMECAHPGAWMRDPEREAWEAAYDAVEGSPMTEWGKHPYWHWAQTLTDLTERVTAFKP